MTVLQWSEALALELPAMDQTHQEFVKLLAHTVQADDATVLNHWKTLIEHTDAHFAQEDRWMAQTRFSSSNCHTTQHHVVLQVMREGLQRGQAGDLALVRQMADELGIWFPQHAQTMDAALALHLRRVGYDPATGQVHMPEALPSDEIHGCAGACDATAPAHPTESEALAS